jgi:hypothetical protein
VWVGGVVVVVVVVGSKERVKGFGYVALYLY